MMYKPTLIIDWSSLSKFQRIDALEPKLLKDSQESDKKLVCKIKIRFELALFDDVRSDAWEINLCQKYLQSLFVQWDQNLLKIHAFYISSRLESFFKKGVLWKFAKFTGKHQSFFFNKVSSLLNFFMNLASDVA